MEQYNNIPKNEIDILINNFLKPLFNILKLYKKIIITITLISMLFSGIYAMYTVKPIYQARILLQTSKENNKLVVPSDELDLKLKNKYTIKEYDYTNLPKLLNIKMFNNAKGILRIDTIGYSHESAEKLLKVIIDEIIEDNNLSISDYVEKQTLGLKRNTLLLKNQQIKIHKIIDEIEQYENKINLLPSTNLLDRQIYMMNILGNNLALDRLYERLYTFKRWVKNNNKALNPKKTFDTHIINKIHFYETTFAPKKSTIIAGWTIGGFIFSIILAFILSLIATKKEE